MILTSSLWVTKSWTWQSSASRNAKCDEQLAMEEIWEGVFSDVKLTNFHSTKEAAHKVGTTMLTSAAHFLVFSTSRALRSGRSYLGPASYYIRTDQDRSSQCHMPHGEVLTLNTQWLHYLNIGYFTVNTQWLHYSAAHPGVALSLPWQTRLQCRWNIMKLRKSLKNIEIETMFLLKTASFNSVNKISKNRVHLPASSCVLKTGTSAGLYIQW